MTSSTQNSRELPEVITFPAIDRPHRSGVAQIADVRRVEDLPSRFLLGDLVTESFTKQGADWFARYEDAAGHHVQLERKGDHLWIRQSFYGSESCSAGAYPTFTQMGQLLAMGVTGEWDAILRERLEQNCNVRVFPLEKDHPNVCGIPDGFMRAVLFPVPADRLVELEALHRDMANDSSFRSPGSGIARLQDSVVNYFEGRVPEYLASEMGPVLGHMDALGTPALAAVVREVGGDGTAAWTLRRRHYLYIGTFFIRDIERVVMRLHRAGFVGPAGSSWQEEWPLAPEHCAFVLPAHLVPMAKDVQWFDSQRTRRVFYPDFGGMESLQVLLKPDDENARSAKIHAAAASTRYLRKVVADAIDNATSG